MRTSIIILAAVAMTLTSGIEQVLCQSSNQNYIRTKTYTNKNTTYIETVDYYDGMGRVKQHVKAHSSPTGDDLVIPIVADVLGRGNAREYLPYPASGTSGSFRTGAIQAQSSYYTGLYNAADGQWAFVQNSFEKSPSGRFRGRSTPGAAYGGISYVYSANTADEVMNIQVTSATAGTIKVSGYYQAGTLYKTNVSDGDGRITYTYTDKLGQTVLTREMGDTLANESPRLFPHDTYYVYDNKANLRWVISPEGSATLQDQSSYAITTVLAKNYSYLYNYDDRSRLVEKKLPGAEWEYFVYDKGDRLVASQDGYWRQQRRWKMMRYDRYGRLSEVWARIVQDQTRAQLQSQINSYEVNAVPLQGQYLLESYMYDSYSSPATSLPFQGVRGVADTYHTHVNGLITYSKSAIINGASLGPFDYIETAYYYDSRKRPVQTVSKNHLGGISRTSFKYNFVGNTLARHETQQASANAPVDVLLVEYSYDMVGRLLKETATLNAQGEATTAYSYDPIGRLTGKTYGGTATRETYGYNIQGWLTDQNSSLFEMKLRYYDKQKAATPVSYSGNITEWEWQHKGNVATGLVKNTYGFTYDAKGRLRETAHYSGTGTTNTRSFVEQGLTYDRNGNIRTLQRYGENGVEDNFNYHYSGNQLTKLTQHNTDPRLTLPDYDIYKEDNVWFKAHMLIEENTITTKDNGFRGSYQRFTKGAGAPNELYIGNYVMNNTPTAVTEGLKLTVEYRSKHDLVNPLTQEVLLPANTGPARQVVVLLKGSTGLLCAVGSQDSWVEIRTLNMQREGIVNFPNRFYNESSVWYRNNSVNTAWSTHTTATNGFNGSYQRFTPVSGGDQRISIYNYYIHRVVGIPDEGVNITVEYRSNYNIIHPVTKEVLLPVNTGAAKQVTFLLKDTHSLWGAVNASNSWLEIRTLDLELNNDTAINYNYVYDNRGNMTKDGLNNVTLGYNYLNLVSEVKSGTTVKARYNWLADGTKLGVTDGTGTSGFEYLGSMVYTRSASGLTLESVGFGSGRIFMTAAGPAGAPAIQSAPDGRQVQGVALINPTGEYPEDPYPDDPDNPGCPEVPIVPGDPWGPVVPWEPLDPDKPIDPTDPIAPIDPGGPDIPVGPITPLDPDPGIQIPDDPNMRRGGTYQTMYFIRDHLGSTRVVVNSSGVPQSRHDFYPFGLAHANPALQTGTNRYLYNGKELQVTGGLKYFDYGARMQDSRLGRWFIIDRLAEKYLRYSPYAYTLNNPVNAIDPDGRLTIFVNGYDPGPALRHNVRHIISRPIKNKPYIPYLPSRAPSDTDFYNWHGVDEMYKRAYKDENALYIDGGFSGLFSANDRYNMGQAHARDMISNGLNLDEDEKIRIVGYSMGAAYAAGIASVFAGNEDLLGRLEFVDYIAPHKPNRFSHDQRVRGRQINSSVDIFSGKKRIDGVAQEDHHMESIFGGHLLSNSEIRDFISRCINSGVPVYYK